jgi:hypothetical protein
LNFYKVSTLNYKHIISFIDWRHPYLGAKTELVCYVNHYRKELKLVNRGNITNPDIIANYFYNQYARYKYKNYPNYKLILQDEITFKNL